MKLSCLQKSLSSLGVWSLVISAVKQLPVLVNVYVKRLSTRTLCFAVLLIRSVFAMDSFVCKIVILENKEKRMNKTKKYDEGPNNVVMKIMKANPIKRCLFGVPNIVDTEKMLQEQLEMDRQRFNEKFGFDLKEIERLDMDGNNENVNITSSGSQSSASRKMKKLFRERRRAVFRPYNISNNNQSVMTDFFQTRKNVQSIEKVKDLKESKES